MMRLVRKGIALGALALGATACMSATQLSVLSSGFVGCTPEEIAVGHEVNSLGFYSWQAACRGHIYQCSAWGGVSCKELGPPGVQGPAGPAGPPPWQVPGPAQPAGSAPVQMAPAP